MAQLADIASRPCPRSVTPTFGQPREASGDLGSRAACKKARVFFEALGGLQISMGSQIFIWIPLVVKDNHKVDHLLNWIIYFVCCRTEVNSDMFSALVRLGILV